MVKLLGLLLIASSLLSLVGAAFIDSAYGSAIKVTGNTITNIATQAPVSLNFFDYFEAVAFSYSIMSFIMGVVFLIKM